MRPISRTAQRQIRQEVGNIRTPCALLAGLALVGCSAAPEHASTAKPEPPPKTEEPQKPHTINLGEGSGEKRGGKENREKLWTVKWKSAVMNIYESGKDFSGTLQAVTGTIYKGDRPTSTFEGEQSTADKDKNVLVLEGKVKVISMNPKLTLTCDRVRYEADKKLIKAFGHVQVVAEGGVISGLEEIWTTPDLDVVATPDAFPKAGGA